VKEFGQIDVVVSNAAVNPQMGNILDVCGCLLVACFATIICFC
jgi:NAD(P)-dependent dehydrogenase (short-subunit alcohol dehydrogenase family)